MNKTVKVKSTTIGIDEVQAKRINLSLEKHFSKPIREYEQAIENLPKRREMQEKIVEYLKMEVEKYNHETEPDIYSFLMSNLEFYQTKVLENIDNDEKVLNDKKYYVENSKQFLEHITQFIKVDGDVITYDEKGLQTFLLLIDQFDLDDKERSKQLQKHQPKSGE